MKGHEVKFSKFSKSIYMKGHQLVSDNLVEIVCLWCLSGAAGAPENFLRFFQASRVDFILFCNDLCRNESAKHLSTVSIIHQNHLGKSIYMKGQEAKFSKFLKSI